MCTDRTFKTHCHICGELASTDIEKCKLCCDGFEQEFCSTCASLWRSFRASITDQETRTHSFKLLRERRESYRRRATGAA